MATELHFSPPLADFVLSEASGMRSRSKATVTQSGAAIKSGTVLTRQDGGAGTFALDAGVTGNPTCGTITVGSAAKAGVYRIIFTAATKFEVEDPDGVTVGVGTAGSAFAGGGLGFTITAGGTPAVDGTTAKITIAQGTGKYIPYTANGAAGPAEAILYSDLKAATGDISAVVFDADCEVRRGALTGLDAAAEVDLKRVGIKVRGTSGLPTVSTPAL